MADVVAWWKKRQCLQRTRGRRKALQDYKRKIRRRDKFPRKIERHEACHVFLHTVTIVLAFLSIPLCEPTWTVGVPRLFFLMRRVHATSFNMQGEHSYKPSDVARAHSIPSTSGSCVPPQTQWLALTSRHVTPHANAVRDVLRLFRQRQDVMQQQDVRQQLK